MLTTSLLGTLEDERSIWKYRIINSLGEYAEILNYGVCLHALYIWDNQGNLGSVILGAPDVEALEYRHYHRPVYPHPLSHGFRGRYIAVSHQPCLFQFRQLSRYLSARLQIFSESYAVVETAEQLQRAILALVKGRTESGTQLLVPEQVTAP